jgi:hypothetical protein
MGIKIRNFTLISKWDFLPLYIVPIKSWSKQTRFLGTYLKTVFWLYLLIGARYKGKKPNFEISGKLRIFYTHVDPFAEKKILDPILRLFLFFEPLKLISA